MTYPRGTPHDEPRRSEAAPAHQRPRDPVRRAQPPRVRQLRQPDREDPAPRRARERGTRFASAYCQTPICVPSRGSLATGRWPHAIESWDNATPYVGAEASSWGHRLTEQGHHVTTVGKLHYRRVDDPSGFPDQRVPLHVVDGTGDLYGLLRGDMPPRPQSLRHVIEARAGESEYVRYDRAIAETAVRWLREEADAAGGRKPWVLFVGFVSPHFPLVVPDAYFGLYRQDELPLPVAWTDAHVVAPSRARAAPSSARAHDAARRGDGSAGHRRVLRPRHASSTNRSGGYWRLSRRAGSVVRLA